MKISIVTSLYKSSNYVSDFYRRHVDAIRDIHVDYEFVFVDDGSPDDSAKKTMELIEKDPKVKLIVLSKNFGQYPAMFAGMAHASGDFIFTSDSDLEEPPENISAFYQKMTEQNDIDFLYAITRERKGGPIRKIIGGFFYVVMKWSSNVNIPKNMSWQIMMTKKYVDALLMHKEAETLPAGLMMITGFNHDSILIDKAYKGTSSYSFNKRLKMAFDAITAFSSKPLMFVGFTGITITVITFFAGIAAIISKLFFVDYRPGWISIILSIWFVGGLILSSLGIVGIYIARIFNQVKNRPLYIVKAVIGGEDKQT